MANQERVKLWNVRTTKMTDEMYNFVLDRISKTSEGTFREYAFQLIERDMQQQKNEQKNKEKIVMFMMN